MTTVPYVDTDISSLEFWSKPFDEREKSFAHLRATDPVSWHRPVESQLLPPEMMEDVGFWSVTKYADVAAASRDVKSFSSAGGIFMEDFPPVVFEGSLSFIVTDPPRHTQLRGIVWSAFTPGNMRKLEDDIRRQVREVVDEIAPLGEADLSTTLAAQIPGRLFANLFGITDPDLRHEIMECAEHMASWSDPEICAAAGNKEPIELFGDAAARLMDIALEATEARRKNPTDDLLTWVAEAEFEGQRLEEWEIGSFFSLLSAAANDTTRHTIAHGLWQFEQHPDQKQILLERMGDDEVMGTCVEELVRYATPLLHFRRTVAQDVELGGKLMKQGDKVALWYCSANRDEEQFDDPMRFDILRQQNRHAGFGGGGPHYCMGASLARLTLKSVFREVYTRIPDLRVEEPTMLTANVVHGIKRLPATWTPEKR